MRRKKEGCVAWVGVCEVKRPGTCRKGGRGACKKGQKKKVLKRKRGKKKGIEGEK